MTMEMKMTNIDEIISALQCLAKERNEAIEATASLISRIEIGKESALAALSRVRTNHQCYLQDIRGAIGTLELLFDLNPFSESQLGQFLLILHSSKPEVRSERTTFYFAQRVCQHDRQHSDATCFEARWKPIANLMQGFEM